MRQTAATQSAAPATEHSQFSRRAGHFNLAWRQPAAAGVNLCEQLLSGVYLLRTPQVRQSLHFRLVVQANKAE